MVRLNKAYADEQKRVNESFDKIEGYAFANFETITAAAVSAQVCACFIEGGVKEKGSTVSQTLATYAWITGCRADRILLWLLCTYVGVMPHAETKVPPCDPTDIWGSLECLNLTNDGLGPSIFGFFAGRF